MSADNSYSVHTNSLLPQLGDGSMAVHTFVKDSVGMAYVDKGGYFKSIAKWIKDGGSWYYVGADGYMLSNTTWNGYKFNDSGVCTNP